MTLKGAPILRVDALSKLYARREQAMRDRLGAVAMNALLGRSPPQVKELAAHEFWALNDVSFEVRRGEALGIIGLNGSGKTTLLRILAGQILPDRGSVILSGTSAAMIDLQAGFQPNASGHDNIFLRAAALGFTRRQTEAMLDEIVAFSELEEAIGAPMASYSSGMRMRIAFAVMAMVAPDVLFIDEILAVGDFRFRQKCLAKIREMRARSAFVLVSHAIGDVARFTDRVLVLHKGRIVFQGEPDEAIAFYYSLEQDSAPTPDRGGAKPLLPSEVDRPDLVDNLRFDWMGTTGPNDAEIFEGDPLRLRISFTVRFKPRNLVVGVPIYDLDGNVLTGFATDASGMVFDVEAGDQVELEMVAPHAGFNPGHYRVAIGITDGTEFLNMRELPNLVVRPAGRRSWGTVSIPCQWRASINSRQVAKA